MTGLHEASLRRVLRALTGFGLFRHADDGRFAGEAVAQLDPYPWLQAAYKELPRTVVTGTTGTTAMQLARGTPLFELLGQHPEEGAKFDRIMTRFHAREKEAVADAYDFATLDTVVDVGGGNGTFMSVLLSRYPRLRGIVFDLRR
jgi:hypothetical protein